MSKRLQELLPLLRCPKTRTQLTISNGALISEHGDKYPIINEKPILVRSPREIHLAAPSPEHVSQNQARYVVPEAYAHFVSRALHLGSGNIPCNDPRVISLDVLPCANTDIVAEAEALPFPDDVFDLVESSAVFEHLVEPWQAIREVKRVTRPGGVNYIDTAFLQSYHGFPNHYFNMTPLAAESLLVDDFLLEEAYVPKSATPAKALADLLERFLSFLSREQKTRIENFSVCDLLAALKTNSEELLTEFSEYAQRSLAASFVISARKPLNWREKVEQIEAQPALREECDRLRKEYYGLRMMLILRHHEVKLYERFARERHSTPAAPIGEPSLLATLLSACQPDDMLSKAALRKANDCLRCEEKTLCTLRDGWMRIYLA